MLADQLKQHPGVFWAGELLQGDLLLGQAERRTGESHWKWSSSPYFPHSPFLFINSQMRSCPTNSIFGFETKFYHIRLSGLTYDGYLKLLKELGFDRFVFLTRKNILRKIVSAVSGIQANRMHLQHGDKAARRSVHLDLDHVEIELQDRSLLQTIEQIDEEAKLVREKLDGHAVLDLTYEEDIQDDPKVAYEKACRFLQIENATPQVRFARTNPYPLRDMIENFEQVQSCLSGTSYSWMLED